MGVDSVTGLVLVDLVRPAPITKDSLSVIVERESFSEWIANDMDDDLRDELRQGLLATLQSTAIPTEPPYETELIQAVRNSGLYPDHLAEVAEVVELDCSMAVFLEAVVARFVTAAAQ